ncbi:MAG: Holliday junction branch migration protein RuvA [Clostridia bacterium]|nr:Holliday junction branch migration protein RuvA [Clostridia bacterium]MBQ8352300.1 Holliday junction branch migration protein RuvA [Clostridia bacterium]
MIAYIRGKVLETTEETMIVDVNGLGYELFCSSGAFRKAGVGEYIELSTYLQVKEDGVTLFGFESPKEKELFLKLISVDSVGPKLGISVLSGMSAEDFATAIATADAKRLSTIKGLGKKTAEKIILALHGKISAGEIMQASGDALSAKAPKAEKLSPMDEDAVAALQGLGFTRAESLQAVKKAKENGATTTEDIIMRALQGSL